MYVVISWVPLGGSSPQAVRESLDAALLFAPGSKPDFELIDHPFEGCTVAAARRPSQGAVVALADRLLLCTIADTDPDFAFVLSYAETGNYMACSAEVDQPTLDEITRHP